jgi:hypothetical protein
MQLIENPGSCVACATTDPTTARNPSRGGQAHLDLSSLSR